MTNARIGWINHADAAVLTAVNAGPATLGADRLSLVHPSQYHEQTGAEMVVRADLGAAKAVDVVALIATNATAAATLRVRASTSAADMSAGVIYDSTAVSANVDPTIGYALHLPPATMTARYWEARLADASLSKVQAGRLALMPLHTFARGFRFDWSRRWADPSEKERGEGGQIASWRRPRHRVFSVQFPALTRVEAEVVGLEIERVCGITDDVLFIANPGATSLSQSTIWGVATDTGGVSEPSFNIFTMSFQIEERRR